MNNYLAFIHSGIEAYTGSARKDGVKLAEDCIEKLRALDPPDQFPPRLLILLASPAYLDQAKAGYLLLGINQTFSDHKLSGLPLIGCSTAAVFFNQRIYDEGALLVCLASRRLVAEVAVGANAVREPEKAVDDLLRRLNLDQNRVDHPNPFSNHTLFSFFPGYVDDDYVAPKLHKLMRQKLGARIPIFGGGACANDPNCIKPGLLFAGDGKYNVYDNAMVVAKLRCETPAGVMSTHGLSETGRLLRVSTLSQDKRAIHKFYENTAVDVMEQAEEYGDKVALLAEISTDDDSVIYTPRRREGEPFIRLSREVRDDACFKVMRPDAQAILDSLGNSIERTVKLMHAENPIACLALKCNGLFRFRHKINLDLEEEFKSIERGLNRHQYSVPPACVGGFVDGEAGVDENGRSVLRNWGTAAMIFGDELRGPAPVYRGFEKLADLTGKPFDEPDEAVTAMLGMIYDIGFPGAMISYWIHDEIEDAIVAQGASGSRYRKVLDVTRRPVKGNDISALVAKEKRPRFIPDSRLPESHCDEEAVKKSGIISQYIFPLMTLDGEVYGILQIDLGDLSYKKQLSPNETQALDGIGAMIGSILFRTFHWKESKITRKLDEALKDCMSSVSREEGLQKYLEKVLEIFGLDTGQIRVAREERNDLVLVAGAGPYHEISKIPRRKIDFGDISPMARAFREHTQVIVNHAANNPVHQLMCEHWKSENERLYEVMKGIGSYANLPYISSESGECGTIDLVANKPWFFMRYHVRALEALGDRVAFLLDSLKRKSHESLILNAIPQLSQITGLDHPDKALSDAVTKISGTIKAEWASLFLWDRDLKTYILRAQYGWKDSRWVHGARYDNSGQWAGLIALHRGPRHIYDLADYYRERGWPASGENYDEGMFGEKLSSSFTVEAVGLPLHLAGDQLGVLMLYRRITPGQPTGFLTVDTQSLREASDGLSGLIGLLQHHMADNRRKAESKRRDEVYEAVISKSDEEELETRICSQLISSYQASSVDFYHFERWSLPVLRWKRGIYREPATQTTRHSIPNIDAWTEDAARNYDKLLSNKQQYPEIQAERRQLNDSERKDPKLAATEGIITRICLPLISEARLVGMMDIKWSGNHRIYSLDYDYDTNGMLTLGRTVGSAYSRNQIIKEKKAAEAQQDYAIAISKEAEIKQLEADKRQLEANQRQQDAIQFTTAYVLQNAHRLVNEASDLRGFPRKFKRAESPEEYEERIKELDAAIDRIEKTATWIFNMGGQVADPVRERCRLTNILKSSLEQITKSLPAKFAIVGPHETITPEIFIHADKTLIQEMLTNLLKNAVIAAKERDNPRLTVSVTKISDEESVRISIEDNGVGMSEEQIRNVQNGFFYRSGRRGIGVRIAAIILQAHNGLLEYKSQPNVGTKTIITLPLAPME